MGGQLRELGLNKVDIEPITAAYAAEARKEDIIEGRAGRQASRKVKGLPSE